MTSIDQGDECETGACMAIKEEFPDAAVGQSVFTAGDVLDSTPENGHPHHQDNSFGERQDNRRPRIPPRSRRVPNLLAGPALIPGPMTPNVGPLHPPYGSGNWNQPAAMAIFPNFMLAPSVAEEDEKRAEFVREAMQCAVGLPPILVDTSNYSVQSDYRRQGARPVKKVVKIKRVPSKSPPRFESADFPSLAGDLVVTTPPAPKLKASRFPSKNQLKRITLFS